MQIQQLICSQVNRLEKQKKHLLLQVLFIIWWRQSGSNRRPFECHSNALPTALCPHLKFTFSLYRRAINLSREFVRRKIPAFPSFEFDRILCYTFKKKSRKGRKIKLCWNGSGKRRMCGSIYRTPKNRL